MIEPERPLRLDAPRDEALEHAVKLVAEAWRSFDRFRPEEPPLDERVRRLLEAGLPDTPTPVHVDWLDRLMEPSGMIARPLRSEIETLLLGLYSQLLVIRTTVLPTLWPLNPVAE